jgi:hypothetical protein
MASIDSAVSVTPAIFPVKHNVLGALQDSAIIRDRGEEPGKADAL